MKNILFFVFVFFILSCSDKSTFIEESIISVAGHTYSARWRTNDFRTLYIIYKINNDDTISITERLDTEEGEIYRQYFGFYNYSHPTLDVIINSICDICFSFYSALVAEDKESFTYMIYDVQTRNSYDLVFKIKE